MLLSLLHARYKKAVIARLRGLGQGIAVPDGGSTARAFNHALFLTFGRLARLDGQVTSDAISNSTRMMGLLGLDPAARQLAIDWFNAGKSPTAPIPEVTALLVRHMGRASDLARLYLKTLGEAASLDGGIGVQQRVLLRDIAEVCGFSKSEFEAICLTSMPYGEYHSLTSASRVSNAYTVLQLSPGAEDREIKRAYLRLVSRHHPDKLAAHDRSEATLKQAQARFTAIRDAYEVLCGTRKIRA